MRTVNLLKDKRFSFHRGQLASNTIQSASIKYERFTPQLVEITMSDQSTALKSFRLRRSIGSSYPTAILCHNAKQEIVMLLNTQNMYFTKL